MFKMIGETDLCEYVEEDKAGREVLVFAHTEDNPHYNKDTVETICELVNAEDWNIYTSDYKDISLVLSIVIQRRDDSDEDR